MTPDTARTVLVSIAGVMISWTVFARLVPRLGQEWTTSALLRRLFDSDPILGHLLQVFAVLMFVQVVPDWQVMDLLLAFVIFEGLGHIVWGW